MDRLTKDSPHYLDGTLNLLRNVKGRVPQKEDTGHLRKLPIPRQITMAHPQTSNSPRTATNAITSVSII